MTMHFPGFHTSSFTTPMLRAEAAALGKGRRQDMVRTLLYPYPKFLEIREAVVSFHMPVIGGHADTGKIGGLLGDSRAGKSWVLRSYAEAVPEYAGVNGVQKPVLRVEVVDDWDEAAFGRAICELLGPTPPSGSTKAMHALALRRLKLAGVELLIVDDAHFIFQATNKKQKQWLALIKSIADGRFCNVLLAGLPFILDTMLDKRKRQHMGRGGFPNWTIPTFTKGSPSELHAYQQFLEGVDERLPFASPSHLETKFVKELMRYSDGSVGWTMNLVEAAAYNAINDDAGCIGLDHFKRAAANRPSPKGHVAFAG